MKLLTAFAFVLLPLVAGAQLNNGLIAHWPLNGNANDSSGKGHHGVLNNVTPAAGKTGQPNTGYYFAGDTSSYITVPYQSDLNMGRLSICAVVKPMGFYTGLCQLSLILQRGEQYQPGYYLLSFMDNGYDSSCAITGDTTRFTFVPGIGNMVTYHKPWDVQPYIQSNEWYTVVWTFTDSTYRMYVNGNLKVTATPNTLSPVGTSTDGLVIGNSKFGNWQQYPYSFKGVMDDLRIYNRALTQQEIDTYQTLAINDLRVQPYVQITPNPTNGIISVKAQPNSAAPVVVEVLSILGQPVYKRLLQPVNNYIDHSIDLSAHADGQYILRLSVEQGSTSISRFVLRR